MAGTALSPSQNAGRNQEKHPSVIEAAASEWFSLWAQVFLKYLLFQEAEESQDWLFTLKKTYYLISVSKEGDGLLLAWLRGQDTRSRDIRKSVAKLGLYGCETSSCPRATQLFAVKQLVGSALKHPSPPHTHTLHSASFDFFFLSPRFKRQTGSRK